MAPDREVSACAQSLTLKHPLRAEKVEHARPRRGRHARRLRQPRDREAAAPAADARRLRHQPRRQPRRRRLLLGHGGRARARRPSSASPRSPSRSPRGRTSTTRPRPSSRAGSTRLVHRARAARADAAQRERARRPADGRRDHRAGPPLARGHDPRGPRPAAPDLLLDRGGPRPVGERRDVRHLRGPLRPHLGDAAPDRHHEPPRASAPLREWERDLPPGSGPAERAGLAARRAPWYKSSVISDRGVAQPG